MMSPMSRRLLGILAFNCAALACLLFVSSAFADNLPGKVNPIPPPGIKIADADRTELENGAADLGKEIEALRTALKGVVGKMCADCQRRAANNPLRVLDCKVPEDQPIIEKLPMISAYLDEPCRQHFAEVKKILDVLGVKYSINDRMVRGIDYYSRTTFEFIHGGLGAQSALLGGGRYDGLSEALGGPAAPGIGFALGLDRFILALESEASSGRKIETSARVFIGPLGAGMNVEAAKLARELRGQGIALDLGDESFRLKKSFEAAERAGAEFVVIVGENEVKADAFAVKDIKSGEQDSVARRDLVGKLK